MGLRTASIFNLVHRIERRRRYDRLRDTPGLIHLPRSQRWLDAALLGLPEQ